MKRYIKYLFGSLVSAFILTVALSASAQTSVPRSDESVMTTATVDAQENFRTGNITRAVQQWSQAISENRDVIRSLFNRAQAFIMLGQYEFALADIDRIIATEGLAAGSDVLLVQGIVLSNLNRLPEALVSFDQAEQQQPSALIYSNRAIVRQQSGDYQAALTDLTKAIELSPTPINYLNLANLYIQTGEFETAVESMNQLLTQNDAFFPAYLARGIAYHQLGQYQAALQDFLYSLTVSPTQAEARYYAGLSLYQLGMKEDAAHNLVMAADLYLQQNRADSYHQVLAKMSELGL